MIRKVQKTLGIVLLTISSLQTFAQMPTTPAGIAKPTDGAAAPKPGPKPYKEIITSKAITSKGFFKTHKVEDKYYFEIEPKLFGRDILALNRISKSSIESVKGFYGYAGDQIAENVIRFEKGPNNKVFLKRISYNQCTSL